VSLIADSLKKAVKEKSAPKWEADREISPVGQREPLKRPGLATVFRVLLLMILPAASLVYLIFIGAFALKKTPLTQKRDLPALIAMEEAKGSPRPEVPQGTSLARTLVAKIPAEKSSIEKETVPKKKPVIPKATASLKTTDEPPSRKNEETVFKKVIPPYPPKKKVGKPEETVIEHPNEKAVSLPLPDLKPASLVIPKVPPVVLEKKIIAVPPVEPAKKSIAKAKPVFEKEAVFPEKAPARAPSKVEVSEQKVATKPEIQAKLPLEPVLEKAQVSPKVSDEIKGNPGKLTIEIQKKNPGAAPFPLAKPEISRTDPAGQENVFNNSDYYFNRGIFFQQARDWQKALVNYSKSEELDPNNPDTYNNKGVILKEMGKFDQALDEFLRAVYLDAGYAKAFNNIGVVYFMKKNYREAIRHYLKAIDLKPTNLEAFNNLAIIYKKQKELDQAREILNRALSLDPDHPGTNYNLAVLYEESREIKTALYFFRRFIELGAINYPSLVTQVKEHLKTMNLP